MKAQTALCMIVKDSADTVCQAIESALPFVSEVVIVIDRASDPKTHPWEAIRKWVNQPHIYEQFDGPIRLKTAFAKWRGFGSQRNYSLELATKPWALILDADEVLKCGDGGEDAVNETFARMSANDDVDAFQITSAIKRPDGQTRIGNPAVRIFRRERCRYQYEIHNDLVGVKVASELPLMVVSTYDDYHTRLERGFAPLVDLYLTSDAEGDVHGAARALIFLAKHHATCNAHDDALMYAEALHGLIPASSFAASQMIESTLRRHASDGPAAIAKGAREADALALQLRQSPHLCGDPDVLFWSWVISCMAYESRTVRPTSFGAMPAALEFTGMVGKGKTA